MIKKPGKECATVSARGSLAITGLGLQVTMDLLRTRRMPSIKIGRRYVIPRAALLTWLDQWAMSTKVVDRPKIAQKKIA